MDSRIRIADDEICQTLSERMGTRGGNVPIVMICNGDSDMPIIIDSIGGQSERAWDSEIAPTLKASHYKPPTVAIYRRSAGFCTEHSSKSRGIGYQQECGPTLREGVIPAVVIEDELSKNNGSADGE